MTKGLGVSVKSIAAEGSRHPGNTWAGGRRSERLPGKLLGFREDHLDTLLGEGLRSSRRFDRRSPSQ